MYINIDVGIYIPAYGHTHTQTGVGNNSVRTIKLFKLQTFKSSW